MWVWDAILARGGAPLGQNQLARAAGLANNTFAAGYVELLAAVACDRDRLCTVADFHALPPEVQGRWLEWLVAQEIWRRAARRGDEVPEELRYWAAGRHEVDYVVRDDLLVEVKRGRAGVLEFGWFPRTFPKGELWIAGRERFEAERMRGRTVEDLLRDPDW